VQARYFNVPLFILDTPICHTGFTTEAKDYVKFGSWRSILTFLEQNTGRQNIRL
jgi:hypothetical protein